MAITAAQRSESLQNVILAAAAGVPPPVPLPILLPGVQPVDVLNALVGAIGTQFDAQLTTALNNYAAFLNGQLATAQQQVTTLQSAITQATIV